MKYKRPISLLVICIVILSLFASVAGVFSNAGPGIHEIQSFRGEVIEIYGKGLYCNNYVIQLLCIYFINDVI